MPSPEDAKRALFGPHTGDSVADSLIGLAEQQGVTHDWTRDGWGPFDEVTITKDGAQHFDTSVSGGRGILAGPGVGDGNHRVAYLRRGTVWTDGEVRSLIYGPTTPNWDNNSQQGHMHRVRYLNATEWEGIAVWTSVVFGGDYSFLHAGGVRFAAEGSPTTLKIGGGPPTAFGYDDSIYIERRIQVAVGRRSALGPNRYIRCSPYHLYGMQNGDHVTITGMDDSSFNETDVVVSNVNRETGYFEVPDGGLLATDTDGNGVVVPADGVYRQKRWAPFWLATRVVGGTTSSITIQGKRWKPEEPEPDWGDVRVQTDTIAANADVPTLPVDEGFHGLWAAHLHDGAAIGWGAAEFKRITPALG